MAQDIGLLLRGLGAAVSNQVPQFRQQMAQEQQDRMRQQEFQAQQDLRGRQIAGEQYDMAEKIRIAGGQDAFALTNLLDPKNMNLEAAMGLVEDRLRSIELAEKQGIRMQGDPTRAIYADMQKALLGDTAALQRVRNVAGVYTAQAVARGDVKLPEAVAPKPLAGSNIIETADGPMVVMQQPNGTFTQVPLDYTPAPAAPSTVVTIGEQGASPELAKNIDQQLAAALDSAGVSASAVPQLEMLMQLAPLTTTGAIPAQISRMFPTFNDANAAFIGITNQVLPSLRVPGSGAQSDKDIDVLLNSIGNLGASTEVKQLTIQSLMAKNAINQERADIAEQVISGELTRAQAVRKLREVSSRSILSPELQGQINRIAGLPQAAKDAGITLDEWNSMTPAEKNTFK